jgi:type V secretory pathway adhesin AidA
LDRKNVGGEFSFEYQITSNDRKFSAGYGQFTYDSNPNVSINNDVAVENTNRHSILELRF